MLCFTVRFGGFILYITVDKNVTYQTFEGFGASGAWWAQAVGGWTNTDPASGMAVRDRISQLLFSREQGIGLRTYRYNIGGGSVSGKGDFPNPLRRTEMFETSPGRYDFSRDAGAVYMMRRAVHDGAGEVVLFVNSPIERLTGNGKAHGSKLHWSNLPAKNDRAFARYCLDVAGHFLAEGLPVRYLSPINEPLWRWTGGQEGCHYSPRRCRQVLRVFARELENRPSLQGLKLAGLENGDIRWFNKTYTNSLLRDSLVRRYVDSVDVHSYFLLPVSVPFFNDRVSYLRRFRRWMDKHYPGVPVKMSEWTHMQPGRDYGMDSALVMANVIYEDLSVLNVTAWQHWVAVSEVDYCDGLLYIDLEKQSFRCTKRYYAAGNFSKYIPHGAVRVAVHTGDPALKALAFVQGGDTVVILVNDTPVEKAVSFAGLGTAAQLVVTDAHVNLQQRRVDPAAVTLPAKSVSTLLFSGTA